MTKAARDIVVFDLGDVLIDWDPRHLYRKLFAGDEAAVEHFLATVCTHEWNRGQDAGRTFAEGGRLLKAEHPDKAVLIDAYCAPLSRDDARPDRRLGRDPGRAQNLRHASLLPDEFLGRDR